MSLYGGESNRLDSRDPAPDRFTRNMIPKSGWQYLSLLMCLCGIYALALLIRAWSNDPKFPNVNRIYADGSFLLGSLIQIFIFWHLTYSRIRATAFIPAICAAISAIGWITADVIARPSVISGITYEVAERGELFLYIPVMTLVPLEFFMAVTESFINQLDIAHGIVDGILTFILAMLIYLWKSPARNTL